MDSTPKNKRTIDILARVPNPEETEKLNFGFAVMEAKFQNRNVKVTMLPPVSNVNLLSLKVKDPRHNGLIIEIAMTRDDWVALLQREDIPKRLLEDGSKWVWDDSKIQFNKPLVWRDGVAVTIAEDPGNKSKKKKGH